MPDVRKEKTYDGRWTVFIGSQVVITDLGERGAEELVTSYQKVASREVALDVWSRNLVVRVIREPGRVVCPGFADGLVGGEAA